MPSKLPRSSSKLKNLKLTLEYDGSSFFGFQRQKEKPTIQQAVEKALSRLLNQPTKISAAAGRTDSGVHALGQVVNFKTDSQLSISQIQKGINALLPKAIAVKKAEAVPLDFHARYGAQWKIYEYKILTSRIRSPLIDRKAYQYPHSLNLSAIKKAAQLLVGRHDFKVFQASGSNVKGSVRTIRSLQIKKTGPLVLFQIEADGFLYHMVRNIVGTLLEIGRGKLFVQELPRLLKAGDRSLAGPTLPSQGLTLISVKYH